MTFQPVNMIFISQESITLKYLDCKTVVFGRFRKARSAVSAILACEARARLSPFSLAVFTFAPDRLAFAY